MTRRVPNADSEKTMLLTLDASEAAYLDGVLTSIHPDRLAYPVLSDEFLNEVAESAPRLQTLLSMVIAEHPIRVRSKVQGTRTVYHVIGLAPFFQLAKACRLRRELSADMRIRVRIVRGPCDTERLALIDGFLFQMFLASACDYEVATQATIQFRRVQEEGQPPQPLLTRRGHAGLLPIGPREFCLMYRIDEKTYTNITGRMRGSDRALPRKARGHIRRLAAIEDTSTSTVSVLSRSPRKRTNSGKAGPHQSLPRTTSKTKLPVTGNADIKHRIAKRPRAMQRSAEEKQLILRF
jgi:hypothetical protein